MKRICPLLLCCIFIINYGVAFAQLADSLSQSVTVVYPNGGERLAVDRSIKIAWECTYDCNLRIEYSTDAGETWETIIVFNQLLGSYTWSSPTVISTDYLIRLTDAANPQISDVSNDTFSVVQPSITIDYPDGGETFIAGRYFSLNWTMTTDDNVKIEYTLDGGATWKTINSNAPSTGSYDWLVPYKASDDCWIKITDRLNTNIYDISDAAFSILPNVLALVSPRGGETLVAGTQETISWLYMGALEKISVEYSINNGDDWTVIVNEIDAEQYHLQWTIPDVSASNCLIRIKDISYPATADQNKTVFTIEKATSVNESPSAFWLGDAYPNPFNPLTTIEFSLAEESRVELKVYNLSGQEVATLKNENMSPGIHSVTWNAAGLPTGLYFYSLKTGEFADIKKMTLMK